MTGGQAQVWGGLLVPAPCWLPRGATFLWAQNLHCPAVTGAAWPFLPSLVVTRIPRPQADSCRSSSTSGIHMWLALFRKEGGVTSGWRNRRILRGPVTLGRGSKPLTHHAACFCLVCAPFSQQEDVQVTWLFPEITASSLRFTRDLALM